MGRPSSQRQHPSITIDLQERAPPRCLGFEGQGNHVCPPLVLDTRLGLGFEARPGVSVGLAQRDRWAAQLPPSPAPGAPIKPTSPFQIAWELGHGHAWCQAASTHLHSSRRQVIVAEPGAAKLVVILQHFCREHLNLMLLHSLQQILVFNCGLMISPVNISFLLIMKHSCLL